MVMKQTPPAGDGGDTGGAVPESLADLAGEAAALDMAPAVAAQAAQAGHAEQVMQSDASELLGALLAVRAMAFPMLSMTLDAERMGMLEQCWNDGVLGQSAEAGARVMALHGWTMGGAFDRYGPYVMLVAALAPPVMLTKQILTPPPKSKPGTAQPVGGGANASVES